MERGGRPLLGGSLGRERDAERPGPERIGSAHRGDHRERHRVVPQSPEVVPEPTHGGDGRSKPTCPVAGDSRGAHGGDHASGDRARGGACAGATAQLDRVGCLPRGLTALAELHREVRRRGFDHGVREAKLHRSTGRRRPKPASVARISQGTSRKALAVSSSSGSVANSSAR